MSVPVLLQEEAGLRFLEAVEDPVTRELMAVAYDAVKARFAAGRELPASDFDLLFFMQATTRLFSQHHTLRLVLAGRTDYDWGTE
jgi:hypothetical protein